MSLLTCRWLCGVYCGLILASVGCGQVHASHVQSGTLTVRGVLAAFTSVGVRLRQLPGGPSGLTLLERVDRTSELTVGVYRSVSDAKQSEFLLKGSWPSEHATGRRILNVIVARRLLHAKRAEPFPADVRAALSHL